MILHNGDVVRQSFQVENACQLRAGRVVNIDHEQTGSKICDVGKSSSHRHAACIRDWITADALRMRRVADVNHDKTSAPIRDVRIIPRYRHR